MRIYILGTIALCSFILITLVDARKRKSSGNHDTVDGPIEKAVKDAKAKGIVVEGLCEGDMLVDEDLQSTVGMHSCTQSKTSQRRRRRRRKRGAVKSIYLWPNAHIRYFVPPDYHIAQKALIQQAADVWSSKTCVRLEEVDQTYIDSGAVDYVRIDDSVGGCYASVAYVGPLPKKLNLDKTEQCWNIRIATHEFGHILGLFHEHSRPDRDDFVEILYQNIATNAEHNFAKQDAMFLNSRDLPYDYYSVMHYGSYFFSKDENKKTLKTLDETYQDKIGKSAIPSFYDFKVISLMYNCKERMGCTNSCEGEGYVGPDCQCMCPYNDHVDTAPCSGTASTTTSTTTTSTTTTTTPTPTTTASTTTRTTTTSTTTPTPTTTGPCVDIWSGKKCRRRKKRCGRDTEVQKNCRKTCGLCTEPQNSVNDAFSHDLHATDDWESDFDNIWPKDDESAGADFNDPNDWLL